MLKGFKQYLKSTDWTEIMLEKEHVANNFTIEKCSNTNRIVI